MLTQAELLSITPVNRRELSVFVNQVRKHWCPFIENIGQCDGLCGENNTCAAALKKAIEGIRPEANNRIAVLIWQLRNERASLREQAELPHLERNRWGEVAQNDPFSTLATQLVPQPIHES